MAWNTRVRRLAFSFAVAVTLLILNSSQLMRNVRLNREIEKAARILALGVQPLHEVQGFWWGQDKLVHTENVLVLGWRLWSSERFRIEVESDKAAIAWDSRLRSITPEEYFTSCTVVYCRLSPHRFRVHLTGQDGICSEFEDDGDFRFIDDISRFGGVSTHLDCGNPYKLSNWSSDAYRFDVSAERLCD